MSEAPDPHLIGELFAKDPLHLTREDKTAMIEHYRRNRALWVQSGKPTGRALKKAPPAGGISLEDLEL